MRVPTTYVSKDIQGDSKYSTTIVNMSQTHSDANQSTNSSRPPTMRASQEADHDATSVTFYTNTQAPVSSPWEALISSDGRTFYANHATRSTAWERPEPDRGGDGANTQARLPPAWQELVDGDGRTYYANHESRTTTFERPEGLTGSGELPPGWELSRNTQRVAYFSDHNTRTTTWFDPRSSS